MKKGSFSIRPMHFALAGLLSAVMLAGSILPTQAVTKMTLSQSQGELAYASTQSVEVDGRPVEFQMYALKDADGYDTNYVKLRDVAYVLNGTSAQFDVEWNGQVEARSGSSYSPNGSEMYTPYRGDRPYTRPGGATVVDGEDRYLDAIVLTDDNGGGYTYYKLRDLGSAMGFTVDWSSERGVYIETQAAQDDEEDEENEDAEQTEELEGAWEPDPFENNAYIILSLDTVTTWEDACVYCMEQGGHLATIDSQAENDHIRALLAEAEVSYAFLGLSEEEDIWSWYNGLPLRYSNWAVGQPGSGSYAVINSNGTWSAKVFSGAASFICEWDN